MKTVGDLVEFAEPGGHAEGDAAAAGDGVDLVHRGLQQLLERHEVLGGAPLGDLEDLGLRTVDHLGDVLAVGARVAVLHDAGAGVDEATQDGLLRDDLGVVRGVRGGGDGLGEGHEVGGAADAAQFAATIQFRRDRHRVGGLASAVEVEDRVVDGLVCGPVEVARAQHLEDVGDRVLAQQHAAEHRLLGSGGPGYSEWPRSSTTANATVLPRNEPATPPEPRSGRRPALSLYSRPPTNPGRPAGASRDMLAATLGVSRSPHQTGLCTQLWMNWGRGTLEC